VKMVQSVAASVALDNSETGPSYRGSARCGHAWDLREIPVFVYSSTHSLIYFTEQSLLQKLVLFFFAPSRSVGRRRF
jgi:hypothetical protein